MSKKLSVVDLKKICKQKGVKGYSKMTKAQLEKACLGSVKPMTPEQKVKQKVKKMTVADLKKICKQKGVSGYSKMTKAQLEKVCLKSLSPKTSTPKTKTPKTSLKRFMDDLPKDISDIVKDNLNENRPRPVSKNISKSLEKIERQAKKLSKVNELDLAKLVTYAQTAVPNGLKIKLGDLTRNTIQPDWDLFKRFKKFTDKQMNNLVIHMTPPDFNKAVSNGELKNAYNHKDSLHESSTRVSKELKFLRVEKNAISSDRPKYGCINLLDLETGCAVNHGQIILILKNNLLKKVTFSSKDSQRDQGIEIGNIEHYNHVLLAAPAIYLHNLMYLFFNGSIDHYTDTGTSYMETHLWGDVTLNDIEEIRYFNGIYETGSYSENAVNKKNAQVEKAIMRLKKNPQLKNMKFKKVKSVLIYRHISY